MDQIMNDIIVKFNHVNNTRFVYQAPLSDFPVLGQSLSRDDSVLHTRERLTTNRSFKKNRATNLGDSFCSAWTTYYVYLRVCNPSKTRCEIHSYLFGSDLIARLEPSARELLSESDIICMLGRWAADRISGFIRLAMEVHANVYNSATVQFAIEQLDSN